MFDLGGWEILIIVLVIIVFFGSGKISEFARSLGRFTGEFKKGQKEMEDEIAKIKKDK